MTAGGDKGGMQRSANTGGLADDLDFRGLLHQASDPCVPARLGEGGVTVYTGFDPTANSLHVGHLLPIFTLRRFQIAGNRPIVVAGGGTGMVGDPSGRSEERNLLGQDELAANLEAISGQLAELLDFSRGAGSSQAVMADNSSWLGQIGLLDFLREIGKHFSVSQMVAKDSVRSRLETREEGISYTEFSYMLLQAYDFLHLYDSFGCRLQMGASDQWGNITMGIDLIRRLRESQVWGLTIPLLTRPDGGKFGKTAQGTVWLDPNRTSPYELYQYFLNSEDGSVATYLRYLTFLSHDEILSLDTAVREHPELRLAQRTLAAEVTASVHGHDRAASAIKISEALFGDQISALNEDELLMALSEAPSSTMSREVLLDRSLNLVDLFASSSLEASKASARRTIGQGGAYVNNLRKDDPEIVLGPENLLCGKYLLLRKGKRSQHLVRFE